MQTVVCPHCKQSFELSSAFASEYKDAITKELLEKHHKELEDQKLQLEEKTAKKIREELTITLRQQEEAAKEIQEKNKQLQDQLLQSIKLTRELKEKDTQRDLEMQKKLAEEEEKIRAKAIEDAQKEQSLKLLEKEKQLQDALKEAEDMKRKLLQGSQQTQGEAFEVEFEGILRNKYPHDKIQPVGKGIKGGDIIQEVWDSHNNYTGKILWELKNTKAWSEGWIDKLKTDKRAITADEAVIISDILPTDMKIAGFRNGVWVTERVFAISLADTLRAKLIQLHMAKRALEGKDTKMEILYTYLSGTEFKNRIEAIIEAFSSMQQEIEKEKRYFSNKWARDEKAIRQVIDNTIGMHGDVKGIMGNSLPQIKELEVFQLEDGK